MKLAHYVNPPPRLLRFDLFSVLFWTLSDKTWHSSGFSLLLRGKNNSLNMKHWNICWTINWRVLHCWISILCRKGAADPHQKQVLGRSWSRRFLFSKEVGSFLNFFFIYGVNLQAQQSQPHLQLRGCTAKLSTHKGRLQHKSRTSCSLTCLHFHEYGKNNFVARGWVEDGIHYGSTSIDWSPADERLGISAMMK